MLRKGKGNSKGSANGGGKGGNGGKKKFENPEANKTVDEIRDLRAEKAQTLRDAGKEPFAYAFERSAAAAELQVPSSSSSRSRNSTRNGRSPVRLGCSRPAVLIEVK